MKDSDAECVLIVGGASSVGQAIIQTFESNGIPVLATHHHKETSLTHPESETIELNLGDDVSIAEAAAHIKKTDRSISNAIFVSSILPGKNLENYDIKLMSDVLQVNFIGQASFIKAISQNFAIGSQILMMSSISAERGSFDPIYAASKGAVLSFVKSQAKAMKGRPRVNALTPGLIQDSSMFLDMDEVIRNRHISDTATGELLKLDDLAKIIYDLTQPHWSNLNGACIPINGGAYV